MRRLGTVCITLLVIAVTVLLAPVGATTNTATWTATASGQLSVVSVADANGTPFTALPTGVTISPFATGGPTTVEQSGSGALGFAGSFTSSGAGLTAAATASSDMTATATPAGVADGLETGAASIQVINSSQVTIQVTVRFDYTRTAAASVTDPALESVTDGLADVELSEASGGGPSPCNTSFIVDEEVSGVAAPPDTTTTSVNGSINRTATLAAGQSCAWNALVQTSGRAVALTEPTTPTTPTTPMTPTTTPTAGPVSARPAFTG